jgi:hypothetical protein
VSEIYLINACATFLPNNRLKETVLLVAYTSYNYSSIVMSSSSAPQDAIGIAQEFQEAVPLIGPTRNDWERHRPLIKRLYVDEGRKLREVVEIMKQYEHIAT